MGSIAIDPIMLYLNEQAVEAQILRCRKRSTPIGNACSICGSIVDELCPLAIARGQTHLSAWNGKPTTKG